MSGLIGTVLVLMSFWGGQQGMRAEARLAPPRLPQTAENQKEGDEVRASQPALPAMVAPQRLPGVPRPHIRADSALLVHAVTGSVLYAKEKDTIRPMASLTKLMTALVAIDQVSDWDSAIMIAQADDAKSGRLYVRPGDRFRVRDLLSMSLVASANDATLALARASGLDKIRFVEAMNEKARALGLRYTKFADPTGLDSRNQSTASEVGRLLTAALAHPTLEGELKRKEFRYSTVEGNTKGTAYSTNRLFDTGVYEILGGKTGYIEESGYNFATLARTGKGQSFLVVVLGASSEQGRFEEAAALLEWAEQAWEY